MTATAIRSSTSKCQKVCTCVLFAFIEDCFLFAAHTGTASFDPTRAPGTPRFDSGPKCGACAEETDVEALTALAPPAMPTVDEKEAAKAGAAAVRPTPAHFVLTAHALTFGAWICSVMTCSMPSLVDARLTWGSLAMVYLLQGCCLLPKSSSR